MLKNNPRETHAKDLENAQILVKDSGDYLEAIKEMVIESDPEYDFASQVLREVKTKTKETKAMKDSATKPLKQVAKTIDGWFKPALDAMKEAEAVIKRGMSDYLVLKERNRVKAMQEAQALIEAAKKTPAPEAKEAAKEAARDLIVGSQSDAASEGISQIEVWGFEIMDASLLPREYLMPNEAAIKAMVKLQKQDTQIAGVKVVKSFQIRARTR